MLAALKFSCTHYSLNTLFTPQKRQQGKPADVIISKSRRLLVATIPHPTSLSQSILTYLEELKKHVKKMRWNIYNANWFSWSFS